MLIGWQRYKRRSPWNPTIKERRWTRNDKTKPVLFARNLALNSDAATSIQTQSTLVISNSKGLPESLLDIRTSTYQICRIEEKKIWTTTFHKYIYIYIIGLLKLRDILKILWKREEILKEEKFSPLFHNIFLPVVRFLCLMFRQGPDYHFEISGYSR